MMHSKLYIKSVDVHGTVRKWCLWPSNLSTHCSTTTIQCVLLHANPGAFDPTKAPHFQWPHVGYSFKDEGLFGVHIFSALDVSPDIPRCFYNNIFWRVSGASTGEFSRLMLVKSSDPAENFLSHWNNYCNFVNIIIIYIYIYTYYILYILTCFNIVYMVMIWFWGCGSRAPLHTPVKKQNTQPPKRYEYLSE